MYIIGLAPTPSCSTVSVTWFIGTRVTPFQPQVVLFTVTTQWIVFGGERFVSIMVSMLDFGSVAIHGIVTKVGATRVTPVLPLAPWSVGVTADSTTS